MSNPEFTIVIPVHNGANYLESAIKSVLAQSYPHFRILILENASTDNTVEIVRSFQSPQITLVPSEALLSIEQNWGRIIHQSLSGYITFMGHDDLLYPGFLQEANALITAEPTATLYQVQFEVIDPDAHPLRRPPLIPYRETAEQFLAAILKEQEEVCGTGYIMRAEDYRRVGGIPPFPGLLYADVILWYRLTALSCKVCSPKALVGYRVHPHSTHRDTNLLQYYAAIKHYRDFFSTVDNLDETIIHKYLNEFVQRLYRTAAAGVARSGQGLSTLRQAKQHIAAENLFTLYDVRGKIYEAIATLPTTPRRMVLRLLDSLKAIRRRVIAMRGR
jgi:glycosyltransferase involved in cell wall biosynthesis